MRKGTELIVLPVLRGVPIEIVFSNGILVGGRLLTGNRAPVSANTLLNIQGVPSKDWGRNSMGDRRPLSGGHHYNIRGEFAVHGVVVLFDTLRLRGLPGVDDARPWVRDLVTRNSPSGAALSATSFVAYGIRSPRGCPIFRDSRWQTLRTLRAMEWTTADEPRHPVSRTWTGRAKLLIRRGYSEVNPARRAAVHQELMAHYATRPAYNCQSFPEHVYRDVEVSAASLRALGNRWRTLLDVRLEGIILECSDYAVRAKLGSDSARVIRNRTGVDQ